jgi:type II secretory ATPase GspE/PulE/Tfp pilus assembly ATPase PilB-like protein
MGHANISANHPKLAQACEDGGVAFPHHLTEHHARVAGKLEALWGTRDCAILLDDLVFSDRPDRLGFSFDVLRDLFALKDVHEARYPQLTQSPNDPFASTLSDVVRADLEQRRQAARKHEGTPQERRPVQDVFVPVKPEPAAGKKPGAEGRAQRIVAERAAWPEVTALDELHALVARRAKGERLPARDTRQMLEILREYVALTDKDIDSALKIQKQIGKKLGPIGKILLSMGVVDAEYITRVLCMQYGVLMVNLQRFQTPPDVMKLISLDVARKHRAAPVAALEGTLFLAVENPFGFEQREYFGFLTKLKVELVMAPAAQISQRLAEYGQVRSVKQGDQEFRSLARQALSEAPENAGEGVVEEAEGDTQVSQNDATIVGLVNKIISDAAEIGASDIHIESFPGEPLARIRFRRDGRMEDYSQYSASYHRAVVSRIKIMATLNIAERRMAQDGKITFSRQGKPRIDLRVATIPTVRNIENVTIRLLHAGDPISLDKLDMNERDLAAFRRLVAKPYGLLLVCGPTGSGKTTTLHSALRELNRPESKIWTAEDPIEIVQKNICQVQVNPQIGWTFATALRSFLRADPDVIMVGEMRDLETAGMALEASMTGHLVLSTLHTNSASETAARLLDLGVDPFNLSDALTGVLAQRLTRRLCPHCARKEEAEPAAIDELAAEYHFSAFQRLPSKAEKEAIVKDWQKRLSKGEPLGLWSAKGCGQCGMEGYKGRIAVFELLEVNPRIRELIAHKASAAELHRAAVEQGMRSLKQDGIEKVLLGLTDMGQVRAVCT